jgi:hypothetical protein
MKILTAIFSSIILALGLSACGYDGHYRYPCQDPVNWEAPECNPPLCEATGTCTTDLLGYNPKEGKEEITEKTVQETTSDIIEEESSAPAPENVDNINQMVDEMSEGN